MNIISALNVYNVDSPKIRVGNQFDGGYVINEKLAEHSTKVISIGMGGEDSYERDWFSRYPHTQIEAYDGTYPCQRLCTENIDEVNINIFYVRHNVGYDENTIPLNTIIDGKSNVLLKVDVEGAEYNIFNNVKLSNVTGLLLEVHDLHDLEKRNKLVELIQNQFSDLILFHVHGNVWGSTFDLNLSKTQNSNGIIVKEFPNVLELSFIHKRLVTQYELDTGLFPVPNIDFSNREDAPDIQLHWINAL
jgi:hypothetical protein